MSDRQSWPTEIRLRNDRRSILIRFEDGTEYDLPAEYLRVLSPSAEVQGHAPDERKTVPGKIYVAITAITRVRVSSLRHAAPISISAAPVSRTRITGTAGSPASL